MKLGSRLTIYISLIIMAVFIGYGYFHIVSRRDMYIRKMKIEVRSIGKTLKIALEKIPIEREWTFVQDLIDAVEEDKKTLGVIVYHQKNDVVFCSKSLKERADDFLKILKIPWPKGESQESFATYKDVPVFIYSFPLKSKGDQVIGGVAIVQHTSFMQDEIREAKKNIFWAIVILVGSLVWLILMVTKNSISRPISQLMEGVKKMAKGNLDTRINLKKRGELYELAQAFNQLAAELKEAQNRIIQEGEKRLEFERTLQQSQKLAIIGQLASGLAHEIGTPLNIISGRAELIQRRLDDKESVSKSLTIIIQQTERIKKIIHQLLSLVRKKKPEQKLLVVSSIIETSLDLISPQIERQNIKISKEFFPDSLLVKGDADQLQQVLLNLFLNALQAMPEGGLLRISTSVKKICREELGGEKREYIIIEVADSGIGIEKEMIDNIFNPFFTTKAGGTGLGLMVVQGIVQDHEGWVEVESQVGKGSVFKVYLPKADEVFAGQMEKG